MIKKANNTSPSLYNQNSESHSVRKSGDYRRKRLISSSFTGPMDKRFVNDEIMSKYQMLKNKNDLHKEL